jgi:hypothetical protein
LKKQVWCEHEEKISKFTFVNYHGKETPVIQKIQAWWCPECGLHGAESDFVIQQNINKAALAN